MKPTDDEAVHQEFVFDQLSKYTLHAQSRVPAVFGWFPRTDAALRQLDYSSDTCVFLPTSYAGLGSHRPIFMS